MTLKTAPRPDGSDTDQPISDALPSAENTNRSRFGKKHSVMARNRPILSAGHACKMCALSTGPQTHDQWRPLLSLLSPGNEAALRAIGYALHVGGFEGWKRASLMLGVRLADEELTGLAYAVLRLFHRDEAERIFETVFPSAGMPIPLLGTFREQAYFWSERAAPEELEHCLLATFQALPIQRRRAFLNYASVECGPSKSGEPVAPLRGG